MTIRYTQVTASLFRIGECQLSEIYTEWLDYSFFGINKDHIPELLSMAEDVDLYHEPEEHPRRYALIHAWRCLGQFKAKEAVKPLVDLLQGGKIGFWADAEIPQVLGLIGADAIPILKEGLACNAVSSKNKLKIPECFEWIASIHSKQRPNVIRELSEELRYCQTHGPKLNARIIMVLCKMVAVGTIHSIREVYKKKCVDRSVIDINDVEKSMGLSRKLRPNTKKKPSLVS